MFSKKERLTREEITKIMKKPDFVIESEFFLLKTSKNNQNQPKFSIIIPKKTEKSAVKRHFLKRKVVNLLKNKEIKNLNTVVYVKKPLDKNNKTAFIESFDNLINKCIIGR